MSKKPEAPKAERAVAADAPEKATATPAVEAVKPPAETKASGKTVKVEFLRSHPEYAHFAGDKAEISKEAFDRIQKSGPFFKEL